jgi:hypothetical protein
LSRGSACPITYTLKKQIKLESLFTLQQHSPLLGMIEKACIDEKALKGSSEERYKYLDPFSI